MDPEKKKKVIGGTIALAIVLGIIAGYFLIRTGFAARPDGTIVRSGTITDMIHSSESYCGGKVDLIQLASGSHVFYFYEIMISSLVAKIYFSDKTNTISKFEDIGNYVDVGELPFFFGSFIISIPDSVVVSNYHLCVIANSLTNIILGYANLG